MNEAANTIKKKRRSDPSVALVSSAKSKMAKARPETNGRNEVILGTAAPARENRSTVESTDATERKSNLRKKNEPRIKKQGRTRKVSNERVAKQRRTKPYEVEQYQRRRQNPNRPDLKKQGQTQRLPAATHKTSRKQPSAVERGNADHQQQGKDMEAAKSGRYTLKKISLRFLRHTSTNSKATDRKRSKRRSASNVKERIQAAGISVIGVSMLIFLAALFLFALPKAEGYGMASLIEENDRLYVNRLGKINRFSLVYFQVPRQKGTTSIRRIIGLPGDKIVYEGDVLYINGEEKMERFLSEALNAAAKEGYQLTEDFTSETVLGTQNGVIPKGKYLVLGDNRSFATDSRYYGLIDEQAIIGVVTMKLLPLHEMTKF